MERLKDGAEFLLIVLIILAGIYLAPSLMTKEVDVTRHAIVYKAEDETSVVATTIRIRGKFHNQRRGMDEFRGRIMIEELPNTKVYVLSPLKIYNTEKGINKSVLFYASNEKGFVQKGLIESGNIQFDDKFSKIIGSATQDGERYEFVAEARTMEEALALRQQYELKEKC